MTDIVDVELAVKRAGGRKELARELHGMLLKGMDESKRAIEQSWCRGDREALYVQVHKLNGSTRYCGVPVLEQRCEQLEKAIKSGRVDLDESYRQLMEAIRQVEQNPAVFD